jgi:zinc D-Ala-D-Ala carboxypeptidase
VKLHVKARIVAIALATPLALGVVAAPADARIIPNRCTYTASEPTLRYGSSGTAVRQAQCEYNFAVRSPKLTRDGSFGPLTRDAIKRFQRCVGITADGVVGPVTWSHLNYWAAQPTAYAC